MPLFKFCSGDSVLDCLGFSVVFPDVRQRLGKRPHSPEAKQPGNPSVSHREPGSDVHSRLGVPKQDVKGLYSDTREKKSGQSQKGLKVTLFHATCVIPVMVLESE